ncbi:MAG: hypothetical protein V3S79_00765 [Candidatus Thermoplasmatota archaeon]
MLLNILFAVLACLSYKESWRKTDKGFEFKLGYVVSCVFWILSIGLNSL